MATLNATPSISPSSLSISGTTSQSATISWTCPSVPAGSTISSCTLTGKATASMSKGNATITVNGTTVSSGSNFTINLGTANSTSSVAVTAKGGNKNANGTVTFSDLAYTVTYTEPITSYTVTFKDWDGTTISTQDVSPGSAATAPTPPIRDGYDFTGWDTDFSNVTGNLTVTAQYIEAIDSIFPSFAEGDWTLDSSCTLISTGKSSLRFTTDTTTGWVGYYIAIPEDWYGSSVKVSVASISENATLDIQTTDTYEEIMTINSSNLEGIAKLVPGKSYIIFVRTNYLGTGEVSVSGVKAEFDTVLANITSLTLNTPEIDTSINFPVTVKATVEPADAIYNLVWEIDNPVVSVGATNLLCSILGLSNGTCTLTVTDTITGLNASCLVTVSEQEAEGVDPNNIFPPFNLPNTWFLDTACTLNDMSAYSCSFDAPATWTGLSISVPASWYGRTVEIKFDSISENAGLYIQEADTWSELGLLNSTTTSVEIKFPAANTYSDIKIALQAPSTAGLISIEGVSARFTDAPWITFKKRTVGYKPPEQEEVIADAVLCETSEAFTTALANLRAGQTVYLRQGVYTFDSIVNISGKGTASSPINIKGYPGETVIITGSPINFATGSEYINFENFKISDLFDLHWGSAVRVSGGTSYINLRNLEVSNINCREIVGEDTSGCNPIVIYADAAGAITNITVENCFIHDCDTGWSEALTLNGNVSNCLIKNCTIRDITNIGIDLAGNYEWTGTVGDPNNQTHDCIVENCLIMNCQSPYATSAGLYSDGARDNTFRYNVIYNCQCGIELGSEQPGSVSENFTIHNNLIIDSGRCIGIGAYLETGAQNRNAWIYNNTFVCGDNNKENYGLYVERTDNVNFYNNIVYGTPNTKLYSNGYNSTVHVGNNCWYQEGGSKPSIDSTGIFADPHFINNDLTTLGTYSVAETSPCVDAGINAAVEYVGTLDLNGNKRICKTIDVGAFEIQVIENSEGKLLFGNTESKKCCLGGIEVKAIYLGDILVLKL